MTTQDIVVHEGVVHIDGNPYRIVGSDGGPGKVQTFLASQQPGKVTLGDFDLSSHPLVSTWAINNNQGGIGVERFDPSIHQGRTWYGSVNLRHNRHLVPNRLRTTLASEGTLTPAADIGEMASFTAGTTEELYVSFGTDIHTYATSGDTFGSAQRAGIAAAATDMKHGFVAGVDTFIAANGTDIDYLPNGGAWAQATTQPIKYVAFMRDLAWGITNAGALFWSSDLSAAAPWNADAVLPLPAGSVKGLDAVRLGTGETVLYASTDRGAWAHNIELEIFEDLGWGLPVHPDGGSGHVLWRANYFHSQGVGVYRFTQPAERPTLSPVGPDADDGLPSARRGSVSKLLPSTNEIIAIMDGARANTSIAALAGSGASGGEDGPAWTNPTRISADDDSHAAAAFVGTVGNSETLVSSGHDFSSIPDAGTVTGIKVTWQGAFNTDANETDTVDLAVRILDAGSATGDDKAGDLGNWATTTTQQATRVYGGPNDLWGQASGFWDVATKIKDANFGASISATTVGANNQTLNVDSCLIEVFYDVTDATILGWDERGWQVLGEGEEDEGPINAAVVSSAYSSYRLYWGENQNVRYIDLPRDLVSPALIPTTAYQATAVWETPRFEGGQPSRDKMALQAYVESQHPTDLETLKIEYAINGSDSYTELTTKTETGGKKYALPPTGDAVGVAFEDWKWRVTWARDAAEPTDKVADLTNLVLTWRPNIAFLRGWSFVIDLDDSFDNLSPAQRRANLVTALQSTTLVPFTFRDDTGGTFRYFGLITGFEEVEDTGHAHTGQMRMTIAEPV